eukprot:s5115_g1.t1
MSGANAVFPPKLWVQVPTAHLQHCGGIFLLQKELANGKPLWKKKDGDVWIYANKIGHWCFGGVDAKAKAFDWNRCYLYQQDGPQLPSDPGSWHAWNERSQRWTQLNVRVSEVAFSDDQQRLVLAQSELAQLRSFAELRRRQRRDWWRPPAPPAPPAPLPPLDETDGGHGADVEMARMARRAAGLCQLGVDLSTALFDDGQTLLMLAAEQGWTELCRYLCVTSCRSSYLDAREEETGYTAVFYATREGHLDILKLLLGAKASPNIASHRAGATPLLLALMAESASTSQPLVTALLDAKALELAKTDEIRRLLAEAAPKARAPRCRCVAYDKEDRVHIKWFCHDQIYVRSLETKDKAYQAGVRPGWTLKLADGKVVTKIDQLREVTPPVELEFQRHLI